jgi:large subunit ribosomal protein L15
MRVEDLRPATGATKRRRRVGRGPASGRGKTSGKGHKGHSARSGGGSPPGFEGGQMPLYRRLPKRGFLPPGGRPERAVVNLRDLAARFATGSVVDLDALVQAGLVKAAQRAAVKILGEGDLTHALTVRVPRISEGARQKIEAAGGRVEVMPA